MKPHIEIRHKNFSSYEPRQFIIGFDFEQNDKNANPCPFCGGKALIFVAGQDFSGKKSCPDKITYFYNVQCLKCGMGHIGDFNTYQEALKAWNRRVNP